MIGHKQGSGVHLYLRRIPVSVIPKEKAELTKWIYNLYKEKDELIDQFHNQSGWSGKVALPPVGFGTHFLEFGKWAAKWLTLPCLLFAALLKLLL